MESKIANLSTECGKRVTARFMKIARFDTFITVVTSNAITHDCRNFILSKCDQFIYLFTYLFIYLLMYLFIIYLFIYLSFDFKIVVGTA